MRVQEREGQDSERANAVRQLVVQLDPLTVVVICDLGLDAFVDRT